MQIMISNSIVILEELNRLLSKGRYVLYNLIKNVINDIVYYHTDGYIIKNRMDIKIGNNLGDVKYEGCHDKIVIHNLNKIKTH